MAGVTTEELRSTIKDFLKGADLNSLSAKKLRKRLEDHFNEDFTSRKKEIDDLVMAAITASQKESQSDDNDEGSEDEDQDSASSSNESSPKKKRESSSSPSPPPPKKQKPKDSKNDTKPKTKDSGSDSELDDEALARKLQEEERLPRRAATMKSNPRRKNTKKKEKKDNGDKPKRESLYSRKCILSESLAEVVGAKEMARHAIVKRIWEIVRERNLFDPKNKRYVLCDEQLQTIFDNRKRVLLFGMMKYLKSHIANATDL